jgi:hypothetical protein
MRRAATPVVAVLMWLLGIAHNRLRGFHHQREDDRRTMSRVGGRRLLDPDDIEQLAARTAPWRRALAPSACSADYLPAKGNWSSWWTCSG